MKTDQNPFIVKGYAGPELFCDRESETEKLTRNMLNGVNTLLISNRRLGKTSLILHTFHHINNKESVKCLYVDILATKNFNEFNNQLATAMLAAFPEKNSLGKKLMKWVKTLSPVISYDPITGNPQVSFAFSQTSQVENSIEGMFQFMEQLKQPIVIAFDEFQQILSYPEKNAEALLRTLIQHLQNLRFIFSGSSKHMLSDIFSDHRRPFFASTQLLALSEIDYNPYFKYLSETFLNHKRKIAPEAVDYILTWTRRHTYYTQSLCNQVFASGIKVIELSHVQKISYEILLEQEPMFYQYRQMLTPVQWKVLHGIAREDKLYRPNSKEFIFENKIGTPSNVQRAIEALSRYEMIYNDRDEKGSFYRVYNVFLSRWLESKPV